MPQVERVCREAHHRLAELQILVEAGRVKRAIENPKLTEKQAMEILKKLGVYTLEQAPAVIIPTSYNYYAWWPWVQNYDGEIRVGAWRSAPILARAWIDQEMKKKMGY